MSTNDDEILRLDLGLDGASLRQVIEAQTRFLSIIREVTASVLGSRDDVQWVVDDIESNSLDLLVRPEPTRESVSRTRMPELVETVASGFDHLEHEATRPPHFSDRALFETRRLAQLRGSGITSIRVRARRTQASVSMRLVANVDEVVGQTIDAVGTIEGTLERVNVHGQSRSFAVYDALTNERIACEFGHRIPAGEIGAAIEKRVAVTGLMRYRENGHLLGIRAERIYVFPDPDDLPAPEDVLGILGTR